MKIYFMGIGGTAMGNAAILMKNLGHDCTGSDTGIYPPMSYALESEKIRYRIGFDVENLVVEEPDLVVVGNVVSRGNQEMEWLLCSRAFPYVSLPELLGKEILENRNSVVICGTHGKTTTTTISAYLAKNNGFDPGYLIGGVPRDLPKGSCLGDSKAPFFIEGDEYDSAFFDKRSKFILYHPNILVINNIEFDHADIFRDLEDVLRTFRHLLKILPGTGTVIVNADDENVMSLFPIDWAPVITVGCSPHCDVQIASFVENETESSFELFYDGKLWQSVNWKLHGLFNARNAAMASVATAIAYYDKDLFSLNLSSLSNFIGVKRRQEVLINCEELVCVEDFGHHPTAIEGTIHSLKSRFKDSELIVCFEPRSNTSVKNIFQSEFRRAFLSADKVLIGTLHRGSFVKLEHRLDLDFLCAELCASKVSANFFNSNELLLEHLIAHKSPQRKIVCFFSNGSFDGIVEKYCKSIQL
jgi:UDP-N-acetylmuramate: L-alanyl-gamma-D-glutamyl-meso-diaminopimelate ligase